MESNNKPDDFTGADPLDGPRGESIVGTIGEGEYIQESTAIPESGYVEIPETGGEGPQIIADGGDGAIPESTSVDAASSAPAQFGEDKPKSNLKKNLPFLVVGGVAVALAGVVLSKMMGGEAAPAANVPQLPASQAAAASTPVMLPVAKAASEVASSASEAASAASSAASEVDLAASAAVSAASDADSAASSVASAAVVAAASAPDSQAAQQAQASKPTVPVTPVTPVVAAVAQTPASATPIKAASSAESTQYAAAAAALAALSKPATAPAAKTDVKAASVAPAAQCTCDPRAADAAKVAATPTGTEQAKQVAKAKKAKKVKQAKAFSLKEGKPVKLKKPGNPAPSTKGYEMHMGLNGLAWVHLPDGTRLIVKVGDTVPGLGQVKSIDTDNHVMHVGRVTLK